MTATAEADDDDVTGTDPRCGRCGYIVRGIVSLQCPECGADLREAGIDVGRRDAAGWIPAVLTLGALVGWSLMVLGAWVAAGAAIERGAPRTLSSGHTITLNQPTSGAFAQVRIDGWGERATGTSPLPIAMDAPNLKVTLVAGSGTVGTLTADLDADTWSYTGPDGARVGPRDGFGQAAVLEWLTRCTGGTDPRLATEAAAIAAAARADPRQAPSVLLMTGSSGGGSTSRGSRYTRDESGSWSATGGGTFASASGTYRVAEHPASWVTVLVVVAGLAAWLAGTAWLLRQFGPPLRSRTSKPAAGPAAD